MSITVAIVEDDPDIREMLTRVVSKAPQLSLAGSFATAEVALPELTKLAPNVVIMDIQLPGISGIECTRRLKSLQPNTQVLVFTVFLDGDQIFRALSAGANGYILKRTRREEIVAAIEQVWQGGSPMSGEVARRVVESFRVSQPTPPRVTTEAQLTGREVEVLNLLASGQGTKEIAGMLGLSPDTVRFHLKHIYEKLHVRSRTEAVVKYLK